MPLPRDTLLTAALFPVLAVQAAWVVARATRLPEPPGPRAGVVGAGPELRLLILGDSSAAGVGAPDQTQALAPQLAGHLGQSRRIHWQLCARGGATSADAQALLAPAQGATFDAALIVFGVNDVKNMRPEGAWRRDMAAIIDRLRTQHRTRSVFLSGLPPMGEMPILPHPMRHILGLRAARFDAALQELAESRNAIHLPIDPPADAAGVAHDGFHPGPPIYARWAREAAARMRPHI